MINHNSAGRTPEELDIVSAIWVMANNDENNIITYKSIAHRLQLPPSYDVKNLIHSRGELFRPGIQKKILDSWKTKMLQGKSLPSWIRDINNRAMKRKLINQLNSEDVFRSQFRVNENAPKADITIIDWGLQHIERLRKSRLESRDARNKSIQIWVIIVTSAINIILTVANIVIVSGRTN